jgi:hypothetical protein
VQSFILGLVMLIVSAQLRPARPHRCRPPGPVVDVALDLWAILVLLLRRAWPQRIRAAHRPGQGQPRVA